MKRSIKHRMNSAVAVIMALVLALAVVSLTGCEKPATVTGEQGQKLVLSAPGPVELKQGEIVQVKIAIDRGTIKEPVSVDFADLPKGVTVIDATQKIVGAEGMYSLKADEAADLVSGHHAKVTAKGPGAIAVTQELVITIKEKKSL